MGYVNSKSHYKRGVILRYLHNTTIVRRSYLYVPNYWYGDSIGQNCTRKITTGDKAIEVGRNYNWSVNADIVDGFFPIGIIGIETLYSTSLRILSFNLDETTAWLQSECKTARSDMHVTFHILYAPR